MAGCVGGRLGGFALSSEDEPIEKIVPLLILCPVYAQAEFESLEKLSLHSLDVSECSGSLIMIKWLTLSSSNLSPARSAHVLFVYVLLHVSP